MNIARIRGWFSRLTDRQQRLLYGFVALVSLVAIGAQIWMLLQEGPQHSDDCLWKMEKRGTEFVVIVAEAPKGSRAYKAGIREGDRVVAINGQLVPTDATATQIAQKYLNDTPVEIPIPYVVERDGRLEHFRISLLSLFSFTAWTIVVFALLWLIIGLVVVMIRPRGQVQRRFFLTAAAVVFGFTSAPLQRVETPLQIALVLAWGILSVLFYLSWVRFCMAFPVDQKVLTSRGRKLLFYGPIVGYAILKTVAGMAGWFYTSQSALILWGVTLIVALGYFVTGIVMLWRGYRKLPPTSDHRPIKVILVGTVLAGLSLLYFYAVQTASRSAFLLNPELLLPIILVLALPLSFGYAIFKYQVMDFRPVIRATVVYGATMVLVGGLYLAIGYGVGQIFGALIGPELEAPVGVFTFVLFVLLFEPVKRQFQISIENRFFPQHRDYSVPLATYTQELGETVGTVAVAELIARTLRETLTLGGVWVALEDSRGDMLKVVASGNPSRDLTLDPAASTRLRGLLRGSHTLVSLETAGDAWFNDPDVCCSYALGLYAQGRVIGGVLMSRPENGEALSGSQTPFISNVVMQGASALEVARLYEQELARQRYQEELATARRIQESLLPSMMPDFPGISISAISRPAHTVGGDYYEVIRLDSDRFLVMIADVSGKGLPASLYMAELHGMVRIASAIHGSPKEILTMLNEHLCQVIEAGSFITATLLLFDTARGMVSYARAGHTPIIRRTGKKIDTLAPPGLALGLSTELFGPYLQQYTVTYEPGETFILYSDGVSEAMNARREEFGDGRLIDVISASPDSSSDDVCDGILRHVEQFRDGAEPNDDVTIVVVRIERGARLADGPEGKGTIRKAEDMRAEG